MLSFAPWSQVRCTLKMPQRLKLTPREGNVSPGAIPTLAQLGFGATSQNVVGALLPRKRVRGVSVVCFTHDGDRGACDGISGR